MELIDRIYPDINPGLRSKIYRMEGNIGYEWRGSGWISEYKAGRVRFYAKKLEIFLTA